MSVLIKDMEMPESCYYCPFADGVWQKNKRCLINGEEMPRDGRNVQQNHLICPLIEVSSDDVQPMTWIPVTERLPNGNGEYLVSGKDKVWVCEFMIFGCVGGWCNSAMNPCVKYWMPLPEPPKDGDA